MSQPELETFRRDQVPVSTRRINNRPSRTTTVYTRSNDFPEVEETHPEHHGLMIGVIIIVVLIVVGVGILLYFLIRDEEERNRRERDERIGRSCATQAECGPTLFCDGNGICVRGSGEAEGDSCARDGDCLFGLECVNMKCVSSSAANNVVGSETNFALSTVLNGVTLYLLITETGSFLVPMVPQEYSLDYTSTKEEILFQSTNPIYENNGALVNSSGNLVVAQNPDRLILRRLPTGQVQVDHPCGSTLSQIPQPVGLPQPFRAFFPQPVNNRSCPTTWGSSTGTTPINFNLVQLFAPVN